MQIITKDYCPDWTSFNNADVAPELKGETLTIYTGKGMARSSWGPPGVESWAFIQEERFIAVFIAYHHKYHGGQFYRYYVQVEGGEWAETPWKYLHEFLRLQVLMAFGEGKLPAFAKTPGKLREDYQTVNRETFTTYKIVQVMNGQYASVYAPNVTYTLGRRLTQKAQEDHGGGYYSYPDHEEMVRLFQQGKLFKPSWLSEQQDYAILECEISGTILFYRGGKRASTYIKPIREVARIAYQPLEVSA